MNLDKKAGLGVEKSQQNTESRGWGVDGVGCGDIGGGREKVGKDWGVLLTL